MPNTTNPDIAATVRSTVARLQRKHSELAAAVGLSAVAFSRRMTGSVPFSGPELGKLAAALDIPISELYPEAPAEEVVNS